MAILSYQPNFNGRKKPIALGLLGIFCFCTVWVSQTPYTASSFRPFYPSEQDAAAQSATEPQSPGLSTTGPSLAETSDCRAAPGAKDIFVAFKTGVNEVFQKLPHHLLTLFQCVPDYNIYSDVEQTFGDQHIVDVLADLNGTWKRFEKEFEYYETLNSLYNDNQDVSAALNDGEEGDDRMAWKLDKWKFLQIVRKAYKSHPEKKWYFIMEGDTAVSWHNLLAWTRGLNPDREIYTGAQNTQMGVNFAHGGSGLLISRAAMRKLMGEYDALIDEWRLKLTTSCCGDVELARSFNDVGIQLAPSFPILQGETPMTMDWNSRHMCVPAVSWHHLRPREIHELWEMQRNWTAQHGWDRPMLFRDLFPLFVERYVRERRDAWDNISADIKYVQPVDEANEEWAKLTDLQRHSVESFASCRAACSAISSCRQFKFEPGECSLGENIRIGKVSKKKDISSGWILERIEVFGQTYKDCEPNWKFDQ